MPKPRMNFCPQCGKNLEKILHAGIERLACSNRTSCGYVFWNNPTPVVGAIVEYQGEVILVQSVGWPPEWFGLVTGFLERKETPEEGILREIKEELNLDGEIVEFLGVYPFFEMNQLILVYHVKATGRIVLDAELATYKRVAINELRPWEYGTGKAVSKWLEQQGIYNSTLELK